MANITSAGTLAGAVLQTSGLAAQERMLADFAPLFESLGMLLYITAGIGAVISAAMFGNYRMARYLMLGPVFLWFLLGVKTDTKGVIWKLGGGEPRSMLGQSNVEDSSAEVRKIVSDSEYTDEEKSVPEVYRVSWAFNWFTQKIDSVVNSFVDVVLYYENDEDLDFISRTAALDALSMSRTDNPLITNLLVNSFSMGCPKMMGASYALSDANLNTGHLEALTNASSEGGEKVFEHGRYEFIKGELDKKRAAYFAVYDNAKKNERYNLDPSALDYMKTFSETELVQKYIKETLEKTSVSQLGPSDSISCGEMWEILSDAVMFNARGFNDKLFKEFAVYDEDPDIREKNKDRLCREISRNLADDGYRNLYLVGDTEEDGENALHCDLVGMTTLFMLRNTLLSQSTMSNRLQQLKNNMQAIASTSPRERLVPIADDPSELVLVGNNSSPKVRQDEASGMVVVAFQKKSCAPDCEEYDWYPISNLGKVGGHFDTAFNEHQSFLIQGIKQGVFHWAMQLPYYQGVLLYCFSVAYPFFALIVVLPSHARLFFYLPLAWLWVKSWDIGFALVMVVERVLWNLFPKMRLEVGASSGLSPDGPPLPDILHQAMKVDPTFHTHAYYFMLSLAMLSIPSITGYAILRGRSDALASFTDGPLQMSKAAQDRAESAYGISRIASKQQALLARKGIAKLPQSTGFQFSSALANSGDASGPMGTAQALKSDKMKYSKGAMQEAAALQGLVLASAAVRSSATKIDSSDEAVDSLDDAMDSFDEQISDFDSDKKKSYDGNLLDEVGKSAGGLGNKYNKLHSARSRVEGDVRGMFDAMYGSQGLRARILRGGIAAEEASTFSFEAGDNQYANEVIDEVVKFHATRFEVLTGTGKEVIQNLSAAGTGLVEKGKTTKLLYETIGTALSTIYGVQGIGARDDSENVFGSFNNVVPYNYVNREIERQQRHAAAEIEWIKHGLTAQSANDFCQAAGNCAGDPGAVKLNVSGSKRVRTHRASRRRAGAFKDHSAPINDTSLLPNEED